MSLLYDCVITNISDPKLANNPRFMPLPSKVRPMQLLSKGKTYSRWTPTGLLVMNISGPFQQR